MLNHQRLFAIALPWLFLTACGGSSSNNTSPEPQLEQPRFSIAVSDAPVDALSEVVVCFNQVELKRAGGDAIFTVGESNGTLTANDLCVNDNDEVIANTVGINLLDYTGSNSVALVANMPIEAGTYSQLRLIMNEGSYGIDANNGDKIKVTVPSNELKLDGFTVSLGGAIDVTLEFDLRKGMTNPVGRDGYFLKPRGVRLVDNSQSGHISGSVSETLLLNNQCTVNPADSSEAVASVYLYQGADLALETLADNGGSEANLPLASTAVYFDGAQNYNFDIGFLPLATYTIAVSCDTADDPEADDQVVFIEAQNLTLDVSGDTKQVDFGS